MNTKEEILRKLNKEEIFLQKRNGKSEVWKYFSDVVDENKKHLSFIQCNKCKRIFSYNVHTTGTSTLRRHIVVCEKVNTLKKERIDNNYGGKLNSHHDDILETSVPYCDDELHPFIIEDDITPNKSQNAEKIMEKEEIFKNINLGIYTTECVEGKSEVWNHFSSVINAETKSPLNFVKCNYCDIIYTYVKHKTGTTCLQRHRAVCPKSSTKRALLKEIVKTEKKRNWGRQDIRDLITEYKSRNYLWDPSFGFKYRESRSSAVKELAITFKTTEKDIRNKLKNFKHSFIRECRKVKEHRLNGESYVSDWPFFKNLTFLQKGKYFKTQRMQTEVEEDTKVGIVTDLDVTNDTIKSTGDNFKRTVYDGSPLKDVSESIHLVEDPNCEVILNENAPSSITERSNNDFMNIISKHDSTYDTPVYKRIKMTYRNSYDYFKKPQDPDDIFGAYIASEMRHLGNEYLIKKMKRMMQEVILEINQEDEDLCNTITKSPLDVGCNITLLKSP